MSTSQSCACSGSNVAWSRSRRRTRSTTRRWSSRWPRRRSSFPEPRSSRSAPRRASASTSCGRPWPRLRPRSHTVVSMHRPDSMSTAPSRSRARERLSPLDPGIPLGELLPPEPWAPSVLRLLQVERRDGKAYAPGAAPQLGAQAAAASELEARLGAEDVVRVEDRQLASFLEARGTLKRVGDGFAVSAELYERGLDALQTLSPITLAAFRDELGVSRRTAQLLLERYDADGITRRVGDERRLRAAGR